MQKILESLIYTPSVAGVETKMALLLQSLIGECFDETYYDNANNLVFHKQGKGEKIMLCTCLDTPGIIVTGVEEQKVHIAPLGSLEPTSSNQRTVRFENGAIGLLHCEKVTCDTKLCDFTVELFDKSRTVEVGEKGVELGLHGWILSVVSRWAEPLLGQFLVSGTIPDWSPIVNRNLS